MFQIDPLGLINLIPQELIHKAMNTVVDFVANQAGKYTSDEVVANIKKLRSDAAFNQQFEKALAQATQRFIEAYQLQDEDLVTAIVADKVFFQNEQIQKALLAILKQPGASLVDERETIFQSFETVLPQRLNRERVDRAVTYLLKCLAGELWHLPEFRLIYSLQFQRITAEASREQVELQKAQLQALTHLNTGIREALLQLTEAMLQQKLLPGGESLALPAPPPRPKVYHNLPQPDYGRFIGREAELAQVYRLLRPYPHSQHAFVTIDGIGGIGKSVLALEIAHRYRRNYERIPPEERFEAIIWTSAKQTILTADGIVTRHQVLRTLEDIYTAIAVALQREDIIRGWLEEQPEVVRQALTQQRTLLIIDNLETVDDEAVMMFVRELPAPTKAIITTRHRMDVAYPVRLVGMPWEDAYRLIVQESEKKNVTLDKVKARQLYDRTGGVPLALVWSIAQMGFGYGIKAILNRLGQPSGDIVRFCFEGVIERIQGSSAHKLLMALSLFATGASREALGYITDLPELDRDEGLVDLEKLSLINKHSLRFDFLPLTKEFALSELKELSIKTQLQARWIDYFRKLSQQYGGEYWKWTNYDWLLTEGENILSMIEWAISIREGDIALSFARPTLRYLDLEGRWGEMINYGEQLYAIAQSLDDRRTLAWICIYWLGWLYAELGDTERAQALAQESYSLYQELNDIKGMCFALASLGRSLRRAGEYESSEQIYDRAMDLSHKHNFGDGIAFVHAELAKLTRDQGKWEEAKKHSEAAIDWYENHEDEADLDISFLIMARANLGWIEFQLGHYQRGKELIERCLAFFNYMSGSGYSTVLLCRLAIIEKTLGNKAAALRYATETIFWAERLGMRREVQQIQLLLEALNADNL